MRRWMSIIATLFAVCLASCGPTAAPPTEPPTPPEEVTVTIIDEAGRYVEVPVPPQRVVVLNSYAAEVLWALGAGDCIVGVSKWVIFPPQLKERTNLGSSVTPNIELLLAQTPDVVIANSWLKDELREKIEKAGIPVLLYDAWDLKAVLSLIKGMGLLLDRQAEADEYAGFIQEHIDLIQERTKDLAPEERPTVFFESWKPYESASANTSTGKLLALAGANNIAAGEPVDYPVVNAEWVLQRNPDIIVHSVSSKEAGYEVPTDELLRKVRREIEERPGLREVDAVKKDQVYLIFMKLTGGPRAVIGALYFAKWFHSDLFQDIDPTAIHEEMLRRFYDLELKGVCIYPQ